MFVKFWLFPFFLLFPPSMINNQSHLNLWTHCHEIVFLLSFFFGRDGKVKCTAQHNKSKQWANMIYVITWNRKLLFPKQQWNLNIKRKKRRRRKVTRWSLKFSFELVARSSSRNMCARDKSYEMLIGLTIVWRKVKAKRDKKNVFGFISISCTKESFVSLATSRRISLLKHSFSRALLNTHIFFSFLFLDSSSYIYVLLRKHFFCASCFALSLPEHHLIVFFYIFPTRWEEKKWLLAG